MKTRHGFVSNSSSSSFCIYGSSFDPNEKNDDDFDMMTEIEDWIDKQSDKNDWNVSTGPEYSDAIYVGRNATSIKDDETGKQFKDSTETALHAMAKELGITIEKASMGYHEQSWYNG